MAHTPSVLTILYYTIPNGAYPNCYLPAYSVNGKQYGSTYSECRYTESEALVLASVEAHDEAKRHGGDWEISIATRIQTSRHVE